VQTTRLSIIGLGLIGGSIALAVRRSVKHCKIYGYDKSLLARSRARREKIVDHVASSAGHCASQADLIVIATPLGAARSIFEAIAPDLPDETVVTDVCSTKRSIVDMASALLPNRGRRFVGSHPMFGSERSGIAAADSALVAGCRCILTPTRQTDASAVRMVKAFWRSIGLNPVLMSPGEHDRVLAKASHLPQALATLLMSQQTSASMKVSGKGLFDTTRLAGSNPHLWAEILLDNAEHIAAELRRSAKQTARLADMIRAGDEAGVRRSLQAGRKNRARLESRV